MARETDAQKNDREWREVALASLETLTEKVHQLELDNAVMKVRLGFIIGGTSLVTSILVSLLAKWILH